VFLREAQSAASRTHAHRDFYQSGGGRFPAPLEWGLRFLRAGRARAARALVPTPGRVLDVGCGRGRFLQAMARSGWVVQGVEPDPVAAASPPAGVPIHKGDLRSLDPGTGRFDMICLWHVLEHLTDPVEELRHAGQLLQPGGVLFLAVPNLDSIQARIGGEHWFHLDLPRHALHFTPDSLERTLAAAGLALCALRTGQWEMDPFGLFQTVWNRLRLPPNAPYRALSSGSPWPLKIPAMTLIFGGTLLALPASLLFRFLGRGGTIVAVARPRTT